jgi:calcium-dependent protein kinase
MIGSGYYGKVLLGHFKNKPELPVAIKTLQKKDIGADISKIKNEIQILSKLDHPNICKYYETYESPSYLYLIMEYCQGGDLFHRLTKGSVSRVPETGAREIMRKLFLAINHCHSNNIIHRDLKPENIMLCSPKSDEFQSQDLKIIDFGLGRVYNRHKEGYLSAVVGTSYYVAPEVLEGKYGFECDCWSLGVIMYVLLSGHLPFPGKDNAEVFLRIKSPCVKFSHREFAYVSDTAKDLILRLLDRDTNMRYTCF